MPIKTHFKFMILVNKYTKISKVTINFNWLLLILIESYFQFHTILFLYSRIPQT